MDFRNVTAVSRIYTDLFQMFGMFCMTFILQPLTRGVAGGRWQVGLKKQMGGGR